MSAALVRPRSNSSVEYKIVVMGDGGVGKSCITIQLISNAFHEDYDPTIEDSYRHQCHVDGEVARLDILDTAGQEEFHVMKDQYMRQGHGFILVYSITNRDTFRAIPRLIEQIRRVHAENDPNLPIMIVGNKLDLESQRKVSMIEGIGLAKQYGCDFFETSASKRINIDQSFHQLVRRIRFNSRMAALSAKALMDAKTKPWFKRLFRKMFGSNKTNKLVVSSISAGNYSEVGVPGTYAIQPWSKASA